MINRLYLWEFIKFNNVLEKYLNSILDFLFLILWMYFIDSLLKEFLKKISRLLTIFLINNPIYKNKDNQ